MNSPMNPVNSRYTPNNVEATRIVGPGQASTMPPKTIVSTPAGESPFPQLLPENRFRDSICLV